MYREPGMRNSQKRSATRANRSPSGHPEAKRLPDRRGAQNQARGTASAPSCRWFRLAHSEVAERIRAFDRASTDTGPNSDWSNDVQTAVTICADTASAQQARAAPQHDGAQGDCDGPHPQDLTTKSKIPKYARSVRITTDAQMRHGCAGQMLMARAAHLNRGST
jgi:hypothetical protein